MDFSTKLRQLRQTFGYTQAQAAEGCGVSLRTYKGYELAERLPRFHKTYLDIAYFYHVDLEYLLTETTQPPTDTLALPQDSDSIGLIHDLCQLFYAETLTDEALDALFLSITAVYSEAKRERQAKTQDLEA